MGRKRKAHEQEPAEKPKASTNSSQKKRKSDLNKHEEELLPTSRSMAVCSGCNRKARNVKELEVDIEEIPEEPIAFFNPILQEKYQNFGDEEAEFNLDDFSIYCKEKHLCHFDGLVETGYDLYAIGKICPIENVGGKKSTDGVLARLGPISMWDLYGYDTGNCPIVTITTDYAHYYLKQPSTEYMPVFQQMEQRFYLCIVVAKFIKENPEASHSDLEEAIRSYKVTSAKSITSLNNEVLVNNAQFVVNQVAMVNIEYLKSPCMEELMNLTGAALDEELLESHVGVVDKKKMEKKKPKTKRTSKKYTPKKGGSSSDIDSEDFSDTPSKVIPEKNVTSTLLVGEMMCKMFRHMQENQKTNKRRKNGGTPLKAADNFCGSDDDMQCDVIDDDVMSDVDKKPVVNGQENTKSEPVVKIEAGSTKDQQILQSVTLDDNKKVKIGDFIIVPENGGSDEQIGRVQNLWAKTKSSDKNRAVKKRDCTSEHHAHITLLMRATDTILGDAGNKSELFFTEECDDVILTQSVKLISVVHLKKRASWSEKANSTSFFYNKMYEEETARFECLPDHLLLADVEKKAGLACKNCLNTKNDEKTWTVQLLKPIRQCNKADEFFELGKYGGLDYHVGDGILVDPDAFELDYTKRPTTVRKELKTKDSKTYPEYYRKNGYVKSSTDGTGPPLRACRIEQIRRRKKTIRVEVRKFYRPHDLRSGEKAISNDLRKLYRSDELAWIEFDQIVNKCNIRYQADEEKITDFDELQQMLVPSFFFHKNFISDTKKIKALKPETAEEESKLNEKLDKKDAEIKKEEPKTKLKTMEIFSGCGGLSEGLKQSGVADLRWAVEMNIEAAQSFRINNPETTVFTNDCNTVLKNVMKGAKRDGKNLYPQKGEVELLCGGPPCQGFSGMNRYGDGEYSQMKNSMFVTFLSYCEYYSPKFVLIENVRAFISHRKSQMLQMTLAVLVRMNYQVTFGVLQAGHYGLPQTRRRVVLMAASPGNKLPQFPEPLYTFNPKGLKVTVHNKLYKTNITQLESAPFRPITVRDAISDLPELVVNSKQKESMSYAEGRELTTFQKSLRGDSKHLTNHWIFDVSPIVKARFERIPREPGSDWRDLPNDVVPLKDGTFSQYLFYDYTYKSKRYDKKLHGVCPCVNGKKCDPADKQVETLIPWCLVHTADRHNHWSGLYGRISWDGFTGTIVTVPHPMAKQGMVLHPEQHRVVSVRECARFQGFPDSYQFYGKMRDRYRQIGNAVPPPMAKAVGLEILKVL